MDFLIQYDLSFHLNSAVSFVLEQIRLWLPEAEQNLANNARHSSIHGKRQIHSSWLLDMRSREKIVNHDLGFSFVLPAWPKDASKMKMNPEEGDVVGLYSFLLADGNHSSISRSEWDFFLEIVCSVRWDDVSEGKRGWELPCWENWALWSDKYWRCEIELLMDLNTSKRRLLVMFAFTKNECTRLGVSRCNPSIHFSSAHAISKIRRYAQLIVFSKD